MNEDLEIYIKNKLFAIESMLNILMISKIEESYEIESILLSKLTPRMKEFISLRYGLLGKKSLNNDEIAKLCGVEEYHVSSTINLGLLRLKTNQYKILTDELKNKEFKNAIFTSSY